MVPNSFSVAITPSNEARGLREGTWRLPLIGRDSRCIALSAVARPVSELFTYARQHPDKRFVLDEMSTATHSITAKHYADFFRQRPANVSVPTSQDESHPPLSHSHRLVVAGSRDYDRERYFVRKARSPDTESSAPGIAAHQGRCFRCGRTRKRMG